MEEERPTDERRIRRARKGDAWASEARCSRWVLRKVSILDVQQETYAVAHTRLGDFRMGRSCEATKKLSGRAEAALAKEFHE